MSEIHMDDILAYLPHRYPFLLVDRVIEMTPNKSMRAVKNVTMNEPFFVGHFPGYPVMPGVLILEALAQTCALLSNMSAPTEDGKDKNTIHLLAGIDKARFKRVVSPGDQLILDVEITKQRSNLWMIAGSASVDGQLACSAEFKSATKDSDSD